MNKILKSVMKATFRLLLLLPAFLWLLNLSIHRPDPANINREILSAQFYTDITSQMVPFLDQGDVLGFAMTSRYAYRFPSDSPARLIHSDSVGEDLKQILPVADGYVIATQENGLRYQSIQLFHYEPQSRKVTQFGDPRLVQGDFYGNLIVKDDWIYFWFFEPSGDLFTAAYDGKEMTVHKLPGTIDFSKDEIGFNLASPKLVNRPVLEIRRGGAIEYYYLNQALAPRAGGPWDDLQQAEARSLFQQILADDAVQRIWLAGPYLAAVTTDTLSLYGAERVNLIEQGSLYDSQIHRISYRGDQLEVLPSPEASIEKQRLMAEYSQRGLDAQARYQTSLNQVEWVDYINSATSLGLMLLQAAVFYVWYRVTRNSERVGQ